MAGLNDVAKAGGVKYEDATKTIEGIRQIIKTGEKVTIQDFGTFSLDVQDERESRNPSNPGETFKTPAKMIPKFKFSYTFKEKLAEEVAIDKEMLKEKREFKEKYNEKAAAKSSSKTAVKDTAKTVTKGKGKK